MTVTALRASTLQAARDDFYDRRRPYDLAPLWSVLSAPGSPTPRTAARPAAWSFEALDGLDIPLVQMMDASFAEHRPGRGASANGGSPRPPMARSRTPFVPHRRFSADLSGEKTYGQA